MYFLWGLLIGITATVILETILQKNKRLRRQFVQNHKSILGYHIHHSVFGLPFIIFSLFAARFRFLQAAFWNGIGVGIILQHTISAERLVFIEKSK